MYGLASPIKLPYRMQHLVSTPATLLMQGCCENSQAEYKCNLFHEERKRCFYLACYNLINFRNLY